MFQQRLLSLYKTFECCEVTITDGGESIFFTVIYRPPPNNKNNLTTRGFLADFQELLNSYTTRKKLPIIVGDFNIHFDRKEDKDVEALMSVIHSSGLHQLVTLKTHRKGHILDWVLTQHPNTVKNLEVTDKCLSDHYV